MIVRSSGEIDCCVGANMGHLILKYVSMDLLRTWGLYLPTYSQFYWHQPLLIRDGNRGTNLQS